MKKIVLTYGIISAAIIALISVTFVWSSVVIDNEWLGYLVMLIGFSMIFIAIKQYRDKDLGGIITFKKAAQVGLLITLFASLVHVASWEIYYQNNGQEFISQYQDMQIENLRKSGASEDEIASSIEEMQGFADLYERAYFRWLITLLEIFPIGLIITVLSALLLKTKKSH